MDFCTVAGRSTLAKKYSDLVGQVGRGYYYLIKDFCMERVQVKKVM